jgi:hypothetical protein
MQFPYVPRSYGLTSLPFASIKEKGEVVRRTLIRHATIQLNENRTMVKKAVVCLRLDQIAFYEHRELKS